MVVWGWPLEPWKPRLWLEFKMSFPPLYVAMGQEEIIISLLWHWLLSL